MQDFAIFVDTPPVVASKDGGVWVEVQSGGGWLQLYLTRHAAYKLARDMRVALDDLPSTVRQLRDHG